MPIKEATDQELRNLIFENPKVIVKFTKTDCPVCERMGRTYLKLSNQARYNDVVFLRMEASENPVSSQEVHLTGTPFFATYKNSVLATCKLISDEKELEELLTELQ
ncbi:thioredoxin family protein [Adhaeribacter sp. BT258]|uniref:Thioredoxin family protein n=1 Tax=Adhaeribacter terrigena TaxID=2793070 RepID=A0ABS1C1L6_9BACT|nr:thioredoxin family protein [Adhaeribacter terrigena]MBK0403291.1 thioredoxin family protein [Adhaeribacter terrigena]